MSGRHPRATAVRLLLLRMSCRSQFVAISPCYSWRHLAKRLHARQSGRRFGCRSLVSRSKVLAVLSASHVHLQSSCIVRQSCLWLLLRAWCEPLAHWLFSESLLVCLSVLLRNSTTAVQTARGLRQIPCWPKACLPLAGLQYSTELPNRTISRYE